MVIFSLLFYLGTVLLNGLVLRISLNYVKTFFIFLKTFILLEEIGDDDKRCINFYK